MTENPPRQQSLTADQTTGPSETARTVARKGAEPSVEETRRLAVLQRLRDLLPGPQPYLTGICRIAAQAVGADAAGIAFVSDRFLYFAGRYGHLPDRDIRVFSLSDLDRRLWIVPDVRSLQGANRVNSFNGKFASYRSLIAVPIQHEGQTVAILVCCSDAVRDSYSVEGKACLQELSYLAETLLSHEATLVCMSRTALAAVERARRVDS